MTTDDDDASESGLVHGSLESKRAEGLFDALCALLRVAVSSKKLESTTASLRQEVRDWESALPILESLERRAAALNTQARLPDYYVTRDHYIREWNAAIDRHGWLLPKFGDD